MLLAWLTLHFNTKWLLPSLLFNSVYHWDWLFNTSFLIPAITVYYVGYFVSGCLNPGLAATPHLLSIIQRPWNYPQISENSELVSGFLASGSSLMEFWFWILFPRVSWYGFTCATPESLCWDTLISYSWIDYSYHQAWVSSEIFQRYKLLPTWGNTVSLLTIQFYCILTRKIG